MEDQNYTQRGPDSSWDELVPSNFQLYIMQLRSEWTTYSPEKSQGDTCYYEGTGSQQKHK